MHIRQGKTSQLSDEPMVPISNKPLEVSQSKHLNSSLIRRLLQ